MNQLLHGRARNRAIKDVVLRALSHTLWPSLLSVRLGKGTASRWAHITIKPQEVRIDGKRTVVTVTPEQRAAITAELVRQRLIGTFPDDMTDERYPCISWTVP